MARYLDWELAEMLDGAERVDERIRAAMELRRRSMAPAARGDERRRWCQRES